MKYERQHSGPREAVVLVPLMRTSSTYKWVIASRDCEREHGAIAVRELSALQAALRNACEFRLYPFELVGLYDLHTRSIIPWRI